MHDMTARVNDERFRRQQCFDLCSSRIRVAPRHAQCRRAAGVFRTSACAFDLRHQRRDACVARGTHRRERAQRAPLSSGVAGSRCLQLQARGRPSTRAGMRAGSSAAIARLRPHRVAQSRGVARTSRYRACARRSRRSPCSSSVARGCVERFRVLPAQVARDKRYLGLGDDTPRAGHGFFRTEGAPQPFVRAPSRVRGSPSWAMAMPRSARAAASSRKATRFSAPRGSPAASARGLRL